MNARKDRKGKMSGTPQAKTALEPTFSSTEVARYCRVSGVQVHRWIKDGKLKCYRYPGGRYKISKANFREFLVSNDIPVIEEFFAAGTDIKARILIGEDDLDFAKILRQNLQENYPDFEVEAVNDGYEVLMKLGEFRPDLLILDIKMPKINGLEVCQRMKSNDYYGSIKILAITGNAKTYPRELVLESGADEYLIKPFTSDDLFCQVDKIVAKMAGI